MPKIIETDFSNKKVIKKTEINNDVNAPEEPLNDKEHGTFSSSKKFLVLKLQEIFQKIILEEMKKMVIGIANLPIVTIIMVNTI